MRQIVITYKPTFLRDFKKLEKKIQIEAREKMALFTDEENHERLRVHKLIGKLKGCHSLSVTYAHRIIFSWESKDTVVFLGIGTHDIYD